MTLNEITFSYPICPHILPHNSCFLRPLCGPRNRDTIHSGCFLFKQVANSVMASLFCLTSLLFLLLF